MLKIRQIKGLARETLLPNYGTVFAAYLLSFMTEFIVFMLAMFSLLIAAFNVDSGFVLNNMGLDLRVIQQGYRPIPEVGIAGVVIYVLLAVFAIVLSVWLSISRRKIILRLCLGEKTNSSDIFYAFMPGSHPWKVIFTYVMGDILVMLNLLIPGLLYMAAVATGYNYVTAYIGEPWSIALIAVAALTLLWMVYLKFAFSFAGIIMVDRPSVGIFGALKESFKITAFKKIKYIWFRYFSFLFWAPVLAISRLSALWVLPYFEAALMVFYISLRKEEHLIPAYRAMNGKTPDGPVEREDDEEVFEDIDLGNEKKAKEKKNSFVNTVSTATAAAAAAASAVIIKKENDKHEEEKKTEKVEKTETIEEAVKPIEKVASEDNGTVVPPEEITVEGQIDYSPEENEWPGQMTIFESNEEEISLSTDKREEEALEEPANIIRMTADNPINESTVTITDDIV
ncbi:MAG: DUF975 family protein [Eubacteriales bacterium]|nr:DUF975 family protein [Eubacteriales bacterium]